MTSADRAADHYAEMRAAMGRLFELVEVTQREWHATRRQNAALTAQLAALQATPRPAPTRRATVDKTDDVVTALVCLRTMRIDELVAARADASTLDLWSQTFERVIGYAKTFTITEEES